MFRPEQQSASSAAYLLNLPVSAFFQPLSVYLPMLFLLWHMKKRRKLCAAFLLTSILIALVPSFCALFRWDIGNWYWILSLALYPAFIALLIFSALEFSDKNPVFRLFLPGLGLGVVCVVAVTPYPR